jgi:mRNA-degrading endonuclease RelE of RelBE toxin-antitoxin system
MQQPIRIEQAVLDKLRSLPLEKQQEVLDFVEFLEQKIRGKRRRQAGSAKGLVTISDDFDEPLEDFKEYR